MSEYPIELVLEAGRAVMKFGFALMAAGCLAGWLCCRRGA